MTDPGANAAVTLTVMTITAHHLGEAEMPGEVQS
jgi:hypothetical protein